jgi:hypothetical protein
MTGRSPLLGSLLAVASLWAFAACSGMSEHDAEPQASTPQASTPQANTLSSAEQSAGWELLFDGQSTSKWRGYKKDAFPEKGWMAEDGTLRVVGGGAGGDIVTREKYRDFELALDWKVDAPNANSGIIYRVSEAHDYSWQTGPEMQILGDAEPSSKSTAAGGLYALYDSAESKKLMPLGAWNHARVIVVGNHVEHWLNGVKLLECEMHSPDWYARVQASKFGAMPFFGTVGEGHIALQEHGNDVWFRNIKIRRLSLEKERGGAPVELFNGKDTSGWTFHIKGEGDASAPWSVEDGVLKCSGQPHGYIRTTADYQDFVLELDWRWADKPSNSGVLFRMTGEDKVWPKCIEAQLMHQRAGDFWNMGDETMKAAPDRTKGRNTRHLAMKENAPGEWNHYRIFVCGGKVELEINGELVNEAWDCTPVAGKICLQSEGSEIHFRNIRLTPLGS